MAKKKDAQNEAPAAGADKAKPQPDKNAAPARKPNDYSGRRVKVKVLKAIAFDGIRIAPKRPKKGEGDKPIPVEAIVPIEVAKGHPASRVEILGDAPKDAKVGVIE